MSQLRTKMDATISDQNDRSLEVVFLLVLGVFMLLFGVLLFSIHAGHLPYTPDSMYGLFLVLLAFQIITMGKTPFGDLRRSWLVVILGMCIAVVGMIACFVPGALSEPVRVLVGVTLLAGGISLSFQLFVPQKKGRTWMKAPGSLWQLVIACGSVYVISSILGLITLVPVIAQHHLTSALLIVYGISFFYLSSWLRNLARMYPGAPMELPLVSARSAGPEKHTLFSNAPLPLSLAILLLLGVLLLVLGSLLFPVSHGVLPFSPDGQLGLLLVITAIQMMALGQTPVGQFKRSWFLILIGTAFAGLGVFSCIVPGILTQAIRLFLGTLNIAGGIFLLAKQCLYWLQAIRHPRVQAAHLSPTLKKLLLTQTVLYVVSIAFGLSMFLPSLFSGALVASLVVINGLLLFVLASLLRKLALSAP